MVIDDSNTLRRVVVGYLRELSIDSIEAVDGLDALEKLRANPSLDGALVDWDMPRMDGLEFVKTVRACAEYNSLKLMMVTAQSSMGSLQQALEAGADDYLMKPFTPEMLGDKLRLIGLLG